MRVSVNMAITEMTFNANETKTDTKKVHYCPQSEEKKNQSNEKAEFHWDQSTQHNVVKSFYVGYILAHVPAGVLADIFGGKIVFGYGILASSVISLAFPFLARLSPYAFMVGRILQGFGQGVMFPCTSALVAKWAPPNERSTMTGMVQSGAMLGNAAGFIISGIILQAFPGWDPIFYIVGVAGMIWCVGWYLFCYSTPAKHRFITDREKEMIESQIAVKAKKKPKQIPWKKILLSLPFISAVMSNFAHSWAIFTMINEMPQYTSRVLNFNIKDSGLYSAAPHLAMVPTAITTGYVADWLIKKEIMSITTNRKIFSFLANSLPVPFMLAASFAGCNRLLVILLFMCMMFFKGLSYATAKAIPVDMAPNYAGILMAFMNGTGAFAGLISPSFVTLFITGDGSLEEWRNVFILAGFVMISFSVPFLFFGSAEVQPWNNYTPPNEERQSREDSMISENRREQTV